MCRFVSGVPSGRTNNYPKSGRGLGHVTLTIFGGTVSYPSDSLASCFVSHSVHVQEVHASDVHNNIIKGMPSTYTRKPHLVLDP